MIKARIAGFGLAAAAIMALFMFAPAESDSITDGALFFGIQNACAQTSTCRRSPGSICFVGGILFVDAEWVGGSCRNRADDSDCISVAV